MSISGSSASSTLAYFTVTVFLFWYFSNLHRYFHSAMHFSAVSPRGMTNLIAGNFLEYWFLLFSRIDFVPRKLKPPNFNPHDLYAIAVRTLITTFSQTAGVRGLSLFGGLDCGTGLWDWTQRKLRSSFRATETTREIYSFHLPSTQVFSCTIAVISVRICSLL